MRKSVFIVFAFILAILVAGCNTQSNMSNNQKAQELLTKEPNEILEIAIISLKDGDGKTFNSCVIYPDTKRKNVYFGDDLSDDDGYIEALFENLSYEIIKTETQDNNALISCNINNKDFASTVTDIINYLDVDNPLVAAIKNCDSNIVSQKVDIKLEKIDNQWKIMIDNAFTNAISGGHW
ncbi:MAG: hypothetical protein ACRC9L_10335 [Brevinema sp.]